MSLPSAIRNPAVTLSDFLRSLAVPRIFYGSEKSSRREQEWDMLRARQGGTKRLDFFDHSLVGPEGAVAVLRAIEKSPGVADINLAHNHLGDDGLRELLVGLKRLRSRDIGAHLEELNLSDCNLSDVSLYLIALHLLQPSPHPPSIKSLFLNHNHFSLGSESSLTSISETLGATLSSSSSSLRSIAFTSNRAIGPSGLIPLLSSLKLATSHLAEIRLSVTQLTPECAEPLARWLEDPEGGARLQVLGVNACALGQAGVRRIARAVISGRAASLVHIEYHANEEGDDERWEAVNAPLLAKEEGEETGDWKAQLEAALKRNQRVYQETKMAARRLAATARVVFGGNTVEAESTEEEERSDPTVFPFLRLPIELQVHVLRCFLLLTPSTTAHLYPSTTSSSSCSSSAAISTSSVGTILSCPLTESQFLRIIAHCASRSTLETGRRIAAAHAAGEAPSLNTGRTASSSSAAAGRAESKDQDAGVAWEDWFLRSTGCDRFERAARM